MNVIKKKTQETLTNAPPLLQEWYNGITHIRR